MGKSVTYYVCNKCKQYHSTEPQADNRCPYCDAALDKVKVNENYDEHDDYPESS